MASIKINCLQPYGADLFLDSESYLTCLSDDELTMIQGGATMTVTVVSTATASPAALVVGGLVLGIGIGIALLKEK
jgi:hypothetical protein